MHIARALITATCVAVLATAGCTTPDTGSTGPDATPDAGSQSETTTAPEETYAPEISPEDFVEVIDNPFLPFGQGDRWVYEGRTDEGVERIDVTVQADTREVMGVTCTVVRDTVTLDGVLVEDTLDWFAQDTDGNVWYFGEEVKNYADGELTDTEGSWEAGIDGALPGIVMWADPQPGGEYRQEYYAGEAEDMARVVERGATAEVPYYTFDDLLVTMEWTPLEPDVAERKYYAEGIGLVLEETIRGGSGRIELIEFTGVLSGRGAPVTPQ